MSSIGSVPAVLSVVGVNRITSYKFKDSNNKDIPLSKASADVTNSLILRLGKKEEGGSNNKTRIAYLTKLFDTLTSFPSDVTQSLSFSVIFKRGEDQHCQTLLKLNKEECIVLLNHLNLNIVGTLKTKVDKIKGALSVLPINHPIFQVKTCSVVDCSRAAAGNSSFCTSRHYKCFVMEHTFCNIGFWRNNNDGGAVDKFGPVLAQHLLRALVRHYNDKDNSKNGLQPSFSKEIASASVPVPVCKTLKDVYLTHFKYINMYFTIMEANINGASPKVDDIKLRARALAELLHPLHQTVIMMDGHGRIMLQFLHEVVKLHGLHRLEKLRIKLVDLNDEVTQWHNTMYRCTAVESIAANVFEHTKILPRSQLVYYNFCGAGKCYGELKENLKNAQWPLMVSFSTMRSANEFLTDFVDSVSNPGLIKLQLPTTRQDFVTFVFKLKLEFVFLRLTEHQRFSKKHTSKIVQPSPDSVTSAVHHEPPNLEGVNTQLFAS